MWLTVSPLTSREKEFNRDRSRDKQLHRNHDGKRYKPDLAVGKHDSRGDQNPENRAGSADGRNAGRVSTVRVAKRVDEDGDDSRADPRQKIIFVEAAFPPGPLQVHSEKIKE